MNSYSSSQRRALGPVKLPVAIAFLCSWAIGVRCKFLKRGPMRDCTRTIWLAATAFCLVASPDASGVSHAAQVCEAGKGYVAADTAEQVNENFLANIKAVGIETIIRYYDWIDETLPGKTLNLHELALIGKAGMSVAVIFQHNSDCLCTFMQKGRGRRDARRALELARSYSQPSGSAVYFGVDGVDAQFLTLLAATDLPSGEAQARKFVQRYVRAYFQEVGSVMKASGYRVGAYGSGLVCAYLLEEHLAELCWLANATGWPGYESFAATNRWVLKQNLPTRRSDCFGLEVDLNSGNPAIANYGQWKPKPF